MRKNPFEIETRFRIIKPSGFIYAYPNLRPQKTYSLNFTPTPISLNSEACLFGSNEIANKSLRQGFSCYELSPELQSLALNAKKKLSGLLLQPIEQLRKSLLFRKQGKRQ